MKMKKLISLIAGLTLGLSALAQSPHYVTESFLNNCQWVVIPTNTTVGFNYTNVTYEQPILPQGWTNVLSLNTNLNGNIIPAWEKDTGIFCDGFANVSTNYSISIMINNTNLLLGAQPSQGGFNTYPIPPLSWFNTNGAFIYGAITNVFTNTYGIISSNIQQYYPTPPIAPASTSTNQLTFNFIREAFPGYWSTNANDIWAVSVTNNNLGLSTTAGFTVTTNVPAWFVSGYRRIKLYSIVSGTAFGTSTGQLINDVRLNGWTP